MPADLGSLSPDDFAARVASALGTAAPLTSADAVAHALADAPSAADLRLLLEATDCTDAIRAEVARRTQDETRRRAAVAHIRDQAALVHLATASGDPVLRVAAEARLRELERARIVVPAPGSNGAEADKAAERARLYVPRILQQHLADDRGARAWSAEGTAVLVDVSGFTALSERLARTGREGAEHIANAIGRSFEAILAVVYDNGGSLLKFGGDALLVWFEGAGHATRGGRSAVLMRRVLRTAGRVEVPGAKVSLRMSQAIHSGRFDFCGVGTTHVEFIPLGPAWTDLVRLESEAAAGQILVSRDTASRLPAGCVGAAAGRGAMLVREPAGQRKLPLVARPTLPPDLLAHCLSPPVRAHVLAGGGTPEHRPVTIAFVRFDGTDALIRERGLDAAAAELEAFVDIVGNAAAHHQVTFLASDIDADGGKLILTAGAPRVMGDDEQRMLLALREIVDARPPLRIRIGVHRGAVFAGDIGPFFRRTYTVMGDAVNVAARLMASAEPGAIYASAQVLDASRTLFSTQPLPPLSLKGKATAVRAWSVGAARGSRVRESEQQQLPLIGRDAEIAVAREALASARSAAGRLLEVVGDAGVGKTRLIEALREDATDLRVLHVVCESYTASTPYAVSRELVRELLGFGRDDSEASVEQALRAVIDERAPDLAPWLPLLGMAVGLDLPSTPQIDMLTDKNRRAKAHEAVARLLAVTMPEPSLVIVENAHHMDAASAELLAFIAGDVGARPWLVAVTRRAQAGGYVAQDGPTVARIELGPLSAMAALSMAQTQSEADPLPLHVLGTIVQRAGGNPQFLQDLVRAAMASGGSGGLPESAEAAALSRIDGLEFRDRLWVRRASVFGLTFHPRMIAWVADGNDADVPAESWWSGMPDLFGQEPDGYVHFRQSLLRDAAYESLPYSVRRRLHGEVAARLCDELDFPEESAGILSLHQYEAGDYAAAWRYAVLAAQRAQEVYAYVEAARLYARALAAGRRLPQVTPAELASLHEAQAEAWYRASEYAHAASAFDAALRGSPQGPARRSHLLLKRSWVEEKLGNYRRALGWAGRARKAVEGADGTDAQRQFARATSWYASVLQLEGRTKDALRWARRAVEHGEAVDDPETLGEAYYVIGWAYGALREKGAQDMLQRSLEAYQRAGNLVRQAGLLSNLGVVCQWEGRWDEAMAYYERGREDSLRVGDTLTAAVASINIAEILIDRGDVKQGEALLLQTLPLWKSSRYRFFLAACHMMLGRAALRAGRYEEALRRLTEARAGFEHVGAESEVVDTDALIAECRVGRGDLAGGVALADSLLDRGNGVAKLVAHLQRVRSEALRQQGDMVAARNALEQSLVSARKRGALLDITLALLARLELDDQERLEPPMDVIDETCSLLARLKIRNTRLLTSDVDQAA